MFLENSLKEKLKSNYLSNETDISIKFEYKIPKKSLVFFYILEIIL